MRVTHVDVDLHGYDDWVAEHLILAASQDAAVGIAYEMSVGTLPHVRDTHEQLLADYHNQPRPMQAIYLPYAVRFT